MSTSRPGSELRQPKLISVPLPPQHDAVHNDSVEASFWCFEAHCVVQNGKTIHVYALPAFVLIQSFPFPASFWVDAVDIHDDLIAIAFSNHRLDIWSMQTGHCRVIQDFTLGSISGLPEETVMPVSASFIRPSTVQSGNEDAETKDLQLQDPMIVILEEHSGIQSDLWIWRIPRFGHLDGDSPSSSTLDQKPSLFRRINSAACFRSFKAVDRRIIAACYDCTIRIWDITTGNCNWVLMGHSSPDSPGLFLDHDRAYSGSSDGTIRFWDLVTGDCCRVLNPQLGPVEWVTYCPPYIVSAYLPLGPAGTVYILVWSTASKELIYRLHHVPDPGWRSAAFDVNNGQIILQLMRPRTFVTHEVCCKFWDLCSGAPVGEFTRQGLFSLRMVTFAGNFHIALFNRRGNVVLEVVDFSTHVDAPSSLSKGDEKGSESNQAQKGVEKIGNHRY